MSRLEFKKASKIARIKKHPFHNSPSKQRVSVSEAKSHLSAVLKQVQDGQSIIVTDHGKDIARIDRIQGVSQLRIVPAKRSFSEVRGIRAPLTASAEASKSILELLQEDRDSR